MDNGSIQLFYHDYIGLVIVVIIMLAGIWENHHEDYFPTSGLLRVGIDLFFGALIIVAFVAVFVPF